MELRQLRHVLAAIEHRNLGRAAAALNITTPALSKSIANLEAELGARLIDRGPRGVAPTVFGESLARHAKVMAAEERHARAEIALLLGAGRGRVAVGGTASAGGALLVGALCALALERPGLQIEVVGGRHDELIAGLRDGDLDVVVTGFGPARPDPDLTEHRLGEDSYVVVARAEHALVRRQAVRLADVAGYPWIVAANIAEVVPGWERTFLDAGLAPPQAAIASDSYLFIKSALLEGDFVAVLPHDVVHPDETAGRLARIAIEGVAWPRRVRAVTRARATVPPAVGALVDKLVALSQVRSDESFGSAGPRRSR